MLGSIGPTELLLILLIIIIIFGARKLPELGKSLGEGIKNFKKAVSSGKEENHSDNSPKPPAAN
ncbi:MAG: twin-arginine translocase TatA/TatE family subunit [Candidatus Aminicenantes bacterium]|nr:twin-arginine translocase TatA/TatE family subunit [Candidatus Aminicenantes bacterium]